VSTVAQQIVGADARAEQECHRRLIALGRVAARAGKNEVVAPIECGLSSARRDVIERHHRIGKADAAVGADGTVLREQPHPSFQVGGPARRMRRQRGRCNGGPGASAAT
jgi:hypothetical protein